MKFRNIFKQQDNDPARWKTGYENGKILHEVVFTTIQSVAILAAFDIALKKQWSALLFVLSTLGWVALIVYLNSFFSFFINATNAKFDIVRNQEKFSWIAGIIAILFSVTITTTLPHLVSNFVVANFLQ